MRSTSLTRQLLRRFAQLCLPLLLLAVLCVSAQAAEHASARAGLNSRERLVYDELKARVQAVATGRGSSTVFTLSTGVSWTWAELGCSGDSPLAEQVAALNAAVGTHDGARLNYEKVINALLFDCPYDLYWYDKPVGASFGSSADCSDPITATVAEITFRMPVLSAYQGDSAYAVSTGQAARAAAAACAARRVVAENAGLSDLEKLYAYKEAICQRTFYEVSPGMAYGDPWQLTSVFDGDSSTGSICEGYAKAFQYLCDLSDFTGNVVCRTVSGSMSNGTGAGEHMWNLVQMDEETLLVDLTNCDDGSIGWPDGLFLVSGSASNGGWTYTVPLSGRSAVYTYDSATVTAYGLGTLALPAIVPRDIGSAVIHLGQQSVYNGQPQQVVIDAVELDGTVLTPGTDYEIVSGGSAQEVTDTTLVIAGAGRHYTGQASAIWHLTPLVPTLSVAGSSTYTVPARGADPGEGLALLSNAIPGHITGLQVDGRMLDAADYTLSAGDTLTIRLTPAYLRTLRNGVHTVAVLSADGDAETDFTVEGALFRFLGEITLAACGAAWAALCLFRLRQQRHR